MNTEIRRRLTDTEMAERVTREFRDGDIVNLGVGLPVLCADVATTDRDVLLHSEQGLLGYGPRTSDPAEADPYFINARRQCVKRRPGMAILDHAESFGLVRSGRINIAVLGALQVSQAGDLANAWLPGRLTGLLGGAQDFAERAQRVIVIMGAQTKSGASKLVRTCSMVLTARRVVDLVVTDVGVWSIGANGFVLIEYALGWQPDEVCALIDGDTSIDPNCRVVTQSKQPLS